MRDEPTAEERRFYEENGYLALDEFLDPSELERWRGALEEALAARGDRRLAFDGEVAGIGAREEEEQRYYDQVFTERSSTSIPNGAMSPPCPAPSRRVAPCSTTGSPSTAPAPT